MFSVHLLAADAAQLTPELLQSFHSYLKPAEIIAADHVRCHGANAAAIYRAVRPLGTDLQVDLLVLPHPLPPVRLMLADMESTMIEQEMLDELAAMLGIHAKVADITRRAMNGELDFTAALQARVGLLRGQPASLLAEAAQRITVMPGARELVQVLKSQGTECWLVSGGFGCFAAPVAQQLGFDRWFANELVIENGILTGEVKAPILDKDAKLKILRQGCAELDIDLTQTMALGDGANDIPMLQAAGLGIAYHAKPVVRQAVMHQLNYNDFGKLAEILG